MGRGGGGGGCSVLRPDPDFTGVPAPPFPAVTAAAVAHAISCADEAVVLVTLPVIAFAELSGNVPLLGRTDALSAVAGPFPRAHRAVVGLTEALALGVAHVAGARELAQPPEPAVVTDAAAARAEPVVPADLSLQVLTLSVVTLAVLPVDPFVPGRVAGTLTTLTQSSPEAGHAGCSAAALHAGLQGRGAGQRMLAPLACPPLPAVAPPAVALSVTRAEVVRVTVVG